MKRMIYAAALSLGVAIGVGAATTGSAVGLPPTFLVLFECQEIKNTSYWQVKMFVFEGNNCLTYDVTRKSNFEPVPTTGKTPEPSEKVPISSSGGEKLFTTAGGTAVECEKDHMTGELVGSQHLLLTVRYEGCTMGLNGECTTAGQEKGVILTKELQGSLFAIKEGEPKEAGSFFTANTNTSPATFAEFECALGAKVKILSITKGEGETLNDKKTHSCLAGKIGPVNKLVGEGELVFLREGTKQAVKTVKYSEHEFECELETEITFGLIKTLELSSEEDVVPPGSHFLSDEPWELMP
jgi:hypothetical protein